jgi:hypothetical protein
MMETDELLKVEKTEQDNNEDSDDSLSYLNVSKLKQIDPYSIAVINEKGEIVRTLNNDDLKVKAQMLITYMLNDLKYQPRFYNAHNLLKDIIEVKKAFYPEVSKQLTVDATNVFEEQLERWKQERKKINSEIEIEKEIVETEKEVVISA